MIRLAAAALFFLGCSIWLAFALDGANDHLKTERARAVKAEASAAACLVDLGGAKADLEAQRTAVANLKAESDATKAALQADLAEIRKGKAAAEAKLAKLRKPLTAPTRCERYDEVDARLLEALR